MEYLNTLLIIAYLIGGAISVLRGVKKMQSKGGFDWSKEWYSVAITILLCPAWIIAKDDVASLKLWVFDLGSHLYITFIMLGLFSQEVLNLLSELMKWLSAKAKSFNK